MCNGARSCAAYMTVCAKAREQLVEIKGRLPPLELMSPIGILTLHTLFPQNASTAFIRRRFSVVT